MTGKSPYDINGMVFFIGLVYFILFNCFAMTMIFVAFRKIAAKIWIYINKKNHKDYKDYEDYLKRRGPYLSSLNDVDNR